MTKSKSIYKRFWIVLSLFLFCNYSIFFLFQNKVQHIYNSLEGSSLHVTRRTASTGALVINRTQTFSKRNKITANIWKTSDITNDRILAQKYFKPEVNTTLPPKYIYPQNGASSWSVRTGKDIFVEHECPIQHCSILGSVLNPETKVDARLFKENDLGISDVRPFLNEVKRFAEQVWIFFALESPMASPNYNNLNSVINWTATYRPDSTVVAPYEKWVPFDNFTELRNVSKNYADGKTKKAAAFISNCGASNNRLAYIKMLQTYIDVDIFGNCGNKECSKYNGKTCFDMLSKDYKFYLAFENANCRHYITEKFFLNALQNDIIPVVMGAHPDDYLRAAPPGSYIHVEDFPTVNALADYLHKLDQNDYLYNQYFRWKGTGSFIDTKFWCRICAMLWDPKMPQLQVSSLEEWWRPKDICVSTWNNIVWDDQKPNSPTREERSENKSSISRL
ncbi:hypothetical protein ACJMK2_008033 [Sinanodonta woodiana]|uniref:Fucosyltransferase n=1 Tax=Sinanodonta woodiana TaxID=1069815 RepID=A0ABD3VNB6_SINWO